MSVQLGALAAGLVAFSVVHSVLATASVQRRFERRGMSPRTYRLAYNGVSTILLLALAPILRGDLPFVWQARGPWRLVLLGVQVAALLGFVWTLRGFDVREFLGLHAPASDSGRRPDSAPGVQPGSSARLQTGGAYALCRHPLYFFTGLFFSAWPSMQADRLVLVVWIWTYSWIGSIFEERRLVGELGETYRSYQATHWRLLPLGGWLRQRV